MRRLVAAALLVALVGAGPGDPAPPAPPSPPSPLIEAARRADTAALRALIEAGADVNATEGDGSTALLWVSHRDATEAVELLLRAGADPNAANDLGATPLWAAAENGSLGVVERLLEAGADPNRALRRGETPLMTAARAGHAAVVERLLARGADPNRTAARDQTALMWAAARGHAEVVGLLVAHGADVHARSEVWLNFMASGNATHPEHQGWFEHGGNTALMFAARRGDLASARRLVAGGADVNATNAWGVTALAMAVQANFPTIYINGPIRVAGQEYFPQQYDDPAIVAFLLEAGADPNVGADRFTALPAAILHRDEAMVDLLLAHGADPNLPLGSWTPDRRGSHLDFNFHRTWVGARPLWLATRFGTPAMLRSLGEHGADPRLAHRAEQWTSGPGVFATRVEEVTTPLMAAVGMGRTGGAWHVQERGRDVEAETLERVRLLVEMGADLNFVDPSGRTALDGARSQRYESVIRFLVEAGGKEGSELQRPGGR